MPGTREPQSVPAVRRLLRGLRVRSFAAFDAYVAWFKEHPIPAPRTPAGKSAFKFYLLSEARARRGRERPETIPSFAFQKERSLEAEEIWRC